MKEFNKIRKLFFEKLWVVFELKRNFPFDVPLFPNPCSTLKYVYDYIREKNT